MFYLTTRDHQVQGFEIAAAGDRGLRELEGARRALGEEADVQDDAGVRRGPEGPALRHSRRRHQEGEESGQEGIA